VKLFVWGLAIALFGADVSNAQQKELVIGMEMSFPPFEMLHERAAGWSQRRNG